MVMAGWTLEAGVLEPPSGVEAIMPVTLVAVVPSRVPEPPEPICDTKEPNIPALPALATAPVILCAWPGSVMLVAKVMLGRLACAKVVDWLPPAAAMASGFAPKKVVVRRPAAAVLILSRPAGVRPCRSGRLKVVDPSPLPQGKMRAEVVVLAIALPLRVSEPEAFDITVLPAVKQAEASTAAPIGTRSLVAVATVKVGEPEVQVMLGWNVMVVSKSG